MNSSVCSGGAEVQKPYLQVRAKKGKKIFFFKIKRFSVPAETILGYERYSEDLSRKCVPFIDRFRELRLSCFFSLQNH